MGADIHSYIERFDGYRWSWDREVVFDEGARRPWEPFDRSYALFGFLSDVRNPGGVPLIHPVRGLPGDVSTEVRAELGPTLEEEREARGAAMAGYFWNGLFGHSWATGAELVGYDFARRFRCPRTHGELRPSWAEPCDHEADDPDMISVGEYLDGWVDRFREIAALADDPRHVRAVWAFDN